MASEPEGDRPEPEEPEEEAPPVPPAPRTGRVRRGDDYPSREC